MKLFTYQHCPFCARVLYVARRLQIPLEEVVVSYDDAATLEQLVGKKMVPVLVKDDGSVMAESLDIIEYFIQSSGESHRHQPSETALAIQSQIFPLLQRIGYPRWTQLPLAEFATEASRNAWQKRKETPELNFADLLVQTPDIVASVDGLLAEIESQLTASGGIAQQSLVDSALYFSLLRGFCCEPTIDWPKSILEWLESLVQQWDLILLR